MKMKRLMALLMCTVMLVLAVPVAAVVPAAEAGGTDPDTEFLRQLGILTGLEEEPAAAMTRAEFCVMVVRAMGREGDVSLHAARTIFRDVTAAHWARGHINLAASITVGGGTTRLVAGVGTGQFKPDAPITYAQAVTILMRMLGYDDRQAGAIWPNGYLNLASSVGVAQGLVLDAHAAITREQAVMLMSNALRAEVSGGEPYYKSIQGVAAVQKVTVLDTAAVNGSMDGLLRVRTVSGVEDIRQENPVSAAFTGYSGQLLLNAAGRAMAFLPEIPVGSMAVLTAADADSVTASEKRYAVSKNAVVLVGEKSYDWADTGSLQAACWQGRAVWLFCDDLGEVSCIYLPVEDPVRAAKLTVASAQEAIVLEIGGEDGLLTAYAVAGQNAEVETFSCAVELSAACVGQMGQLLLNADDAVVGFVPAAEAAEEVKLASARRSGLVDTDGVTHRIPGGAAVILDGSVYVWNETGYLQLNSHAGRTLRLYRDDKGAVAYVCLFAGGTSGQTKAVMAETVTAGGELARKLGITGTYAITKNGAPAQADDLARYDVAYYDAASNTLRASDRQFTGYIEAAYPNLTEAETVTVSGNEFTVLESAWESLTKCALGGRVTLLLTDDGKAAAAAKDPAAAGDILGVLSTDGASVTLLGSGLTLKGMTIRAKETLYGGIVRVSVYQDEVTCSAYASDSAGVLDIAARTLGEHMLAPVCAVYEHTASGVLQSHAASLSGETGKASYDFGEITWTDTISANAVTAYHLNTAGKVDMILLRDVTGNGYEYGRAVKYTGEDGIDLGVAGFSAYNNAVAVVNADNGGEGVKRICNDYTAKNGVYLGVTAGTHNARCQQVVSLAILKNAAAKAGDFFLSDDAWHVVADAAEIPVSPRVQIYLETADRWVSGEQALRDALAMGQPMTLYYDRTFETGAQIRVIVVEK